MNADVDAFAIEVLFQSVTLLGANHVKMPNGFRATCFSRHEDTAALKMLLIELGIPATPRIPLFQIFQFNAENRSLHRVNPPIMAEVKMFVFILLPIFPNHFGAIG